MKMQLTELEVFLLFVADVFLLLVFDASAHISVGSPGGAHRRQPHRQQRPTSTPVDGGRTAIVTGGSVPCRPVPHEVLWRKLDVVDPASKRRRRMSRFHDHENRPLPEDNTFDENGLLPVVGRSFERHRTQSVGDGSGGVDGNNAASELDKLLLELLARSNIDDGTTASHTPLSPSQRRRRNHLSSEDNEAVSTTSAVRVNPDQTSSNGHASSAFGNDDRLPSVEFQSRYRQMPQLRSGNAGGLADGATSNLHRTGGSSATAADAVNRQHQCRLETYWKKMPEGTFPPYLETGRCRQTSCMFGLYECQPRRYTVKILRRMPRHCGVTLRPSPVTSPSVDDEDAAAATEEVWRFVEYPVVVGCDCSMRRQPGTFGTSGGKAGKRREQKRR